MIEGERGAMMTAGQMIQPARDRSDGPVPRASRDTVEYSHRVQRQHTTKLPLGPSLVLENYLPEPPHSPPSPSRELLGLEFMRRCDVFATRQLNLHTDEGC